MRLLRILTAIAFVALGIVLGALNPQPVALDLGIMVLRTGLGVALLSALLFGALLGGLALAFGVVAPSRRERQPTRGRADVAPPSQDTGV